MAGRPPLSSNNSANSHNEPYGDPFADRPRALQFSEPQPQPYDSTVSLQQEQDRSGNYSDDEFAEKLPLTSGQNFSGGFYPPGYVFVVVFVRQYRLRGHHRPVDPSEFGDPYARPVSTVSSMSNGVDTAWRRRQTIKRGVTKKVKLTNGNFITEYAVPTPVYSAIESKYTSATNTTEFSCVSCFRYVDCDAHLIIVLKIGTCAIARRLVILMSSLKPTAGL